MAVFSGRHSKLYRDFLGKSVLLHIVMVLKMVSDMTCVQKASNCDNTFKYTQE